MSPEVEREMIKRHRNGTVRFHREREFWNDEEKEKLKRMFDQGYGISEIAFEMGRSEPEVMQQVEKMDLYQRAENPKRHRSPAKDPVCLCAVCTLDQSRCPNYKDYHAMQEV